MRGKKRPGSVRLDTSGRPATTKSSRSAAAPSALVKHLRNRPIMNAWRKSAASSGWGRKCQMWTHRLSGSVLWATNGRPAITMYSTEEAAVPFALAEYPRNRPTTNAWRKSATSSGWGQKCRIPTRQPNGNVRPATGGKIPLVIFKAGRDVPPAPRSRSGGRQRIIMPWRRSVALVGWGRKLQRPACRQNGNAQRDTYGGQPTMLFNMGLAALPVPV